MAAESKDSNEKLASYGSWTSPLTSSSIASTSISIKYLSLQNSNLHWIESRPNEKGRNVITTFNQEDNKQDNNDNTILKTDITPKELTSSTAVHEYGGNPYIILQNGTYLTSNFDDGRLYIINKKNNSYKPITNEYSLGQWRYVDMNQNPVTPNQIYAIREQHMKNDKPNTVINCIVCIDINTYEQTIIASGNTFYSYPRISPNGKFLAFITWNHPNMPWDDTMLCLAKIIKETGEITWSRIIDSSSSIMQPKWSMNGEDLYYISDQRNWWEIWRYNLKTKTTTAVLNKLIQYEFGWPCWNIGKQRYDLMDDDTIYAATILNGTSKLIKIKNIRDDNVESKAEIIDLNATQISYIEELNCDNLQKKIFFLGGGPTRPSSIFEYDIKTDNEKNIIPKILVTCGSPVDEKYISIPEVVKIEKTYCYLYKPKNDDIKMSENDTCKPPLLVLSHGGPTSAANSVYNENILFFTSRGWCVANVNYRGSTGYGTLYRKSLNLNWGIYDKKDCCSVAKYLKDKGIVDSNKCAIRGGSAGGYTTLCCLCMDDMNTFNVGCSRYGVSDIGLLLKDTHKFESQYLYPLLGEDEKVYEERSPINCVDKLKCPVLFLQGNLDRVVPINQAQCMFDALKNNKITTSLEVFEGEYHGFKKAESKIKAMDFEYTFYSNILGFSLSKQDEQNMRKPNIVFGQK
eukprot:172964_1